MTLDSEPSRVVALLRREVEWRLPGVCGEEGTQSRHLNGYSGLVLQDEKTSGNGLHNSVNMFNATELYT